MITATVDRISGAQDCISYILIVSIMTNTESSFSRVEHRGSRVSVYASQPLLQSDANVLVITNPSAYYDYSISQRH